MTTVTNYPDLKIHGHATQPTNYTQEGDTLYGKPFKGHEIYVTLSTGAQITMILPQDALTAYNEAMDHKIAHLRALEAAKNRLAESTPSGVEGESGLVPPQER